MKRLLALIVPLVLFSCGSSQKTIIVKPKALSKTAKNKPVVLAKDTVPKPIYVPPEVVRVMILPYEDDQGVLHQGEFLYFTLKPGYWTIASDGGTERVGKMIHVVRTQRELSSEDAVRTPIVLTPRPVQPSVGSPSTTQSSKECTGDCQRKLEAIKRFVGEK